jgi:Mg-chelatase subunit ChlD
MRKPHLIDYLKLLGVAVALGLAGCSAGRAEVGPAAAPTATTVAPAGAGPTAPPAPTGTTGTTGTTGAAGRPPLATAATPAADEFRVTVDDQNVTADTLPRPEAYYADLLARHGRDLSPCQDAPTPQPGARPKPASLGEIELKQQVNVELILDASGSMAQSAGAATKLDTAKGVLSEFLTTLPERANVALRAYGRTGSSAEADKAVSCASSELVYPFGPLERPRFQSAIGSFKATGWTPLAVSLDAAGHDFERFDPATSSNFVYVVTDGLETCDGDPVASAQALHAAGVHPLVNIVGFDVDAEAAQQLRAAAEAGGGKYYEAHDSDELNRIFKSTIDWTAWSAYYNCLFRAASNQYDAVFRDQNYSYDCVMRLMNAEYDEIFADANSRYNRLRRAINASDRSSDTIARQHQAAELMRRVQESWDYATQHEQARWDSSTGAKQEEWQTTVNGAQTEWRRAIDDLSEQVQRQPTP